MSTPSPAGNSAFSAIAKDFVRALNVLLRSIRLYGFDHQLSTLQLNDAWTRLQALQGAGNSVRIGIASNKLLLNGELAQLGQMETGFVQLLSGLGLASVEFDSSANVDTLRAFAMVLNTAKSDTLQTIVEENAEKLQGAHLNRIRFMEQSGGGGVGFGDGTGSGGGGGTGTGSGEATTTNAAAPAPAADKPPSPPPTFGGVPAPENETAVRWIVELANRVDKLEPGASKTTAEKLDDEAQKNLLARLLTADADHATTQNDRGSLVRIAEQMALQYASQKFQKGEVGAAGVKQILSQFGGEIADLRTAIGHPSSTGAKGAALKQETAEDLDRKFWASMPEKNKLSVLLSSDAWVIPARDVLSFVEELFQRGDDKIAQQVVKTYCACITHEDAEARSRTAIGIVTLDEAIFKCGPDAATQITYTVCGRLGNELDENVRARVATAVVKLVQEACTKRAFRSIEQVLAAIAHVEQRNPELAKEMRPRVRVENRLPEFIREALTQPRFPDGFVAVLKRVPKDALAQIVAEFSRRGRRDECESLAEMVRALGQPSIDRLAEMLKTGSPAEAGSSVGLLSLLSPEVLAQNLPARTKSWNPGQQAAVVRQVAASASEQRGELLSALLDVVDMTVLPLVIDELGFDPKATAAERLLATVSEESVSPFVRLKAIEALGRLHDTNSVSTLRSIVLARKMFGWQYPDEMRITALHALHQIQPGTKNDNELNNAFKSKELQMAEHRCEPVQSWLRQRRYPRVEPDHPLEAQANTSKGQVSVVIEKLSLGGGVAQRNSLSQATSDGVLEVQAGFRKFKGRVMIQDLGARRVIFEFVDMSPDDRWRLRQLLNEHLLNAPHSATVSTPPEPSAVTGGDAFNDARYRA